MSFLSGSNNNYSSLCVCENCTFHAIEPKVCTVSRSECGSNRRSDAGLTWCVSLLRVGNLFVVIKSCLEINYNKNHNLFHFSERGILHYSIIDVRGSATPLPFDPVPSLKSETLSSLKLRSRWQGFRTCLWLLKLSRATLITMFLQNVICPQPGSKDCGGCSLRATQ